jgi:S1-C subfamily serine protease
MIKFLNTSLFLLFFFIANTCYAGIPDETLHKNCLYPTIMISKSNHGFGSGVIIRNEKTKNNLYKNCFITCGHICDETISDYNITVFFYENWSQIKEVKTYKGTIYSANSDSDIAVGFFYSDRELPTAKLDFSQKLFIGNEVFKIGCGLGDEPRLDYGRITTYRKGNKPYFRTSTEVVPGDSGCPLFHENKVVGIIVSMRANDKELIHFISFAVPLERFKTWDKNLAFIWDEAKPMPEMPFMYLNFKGVPEIKKK